MYIVVNLTHIRKDNTIPQASSPTKLHNSHADAVAEASRLAMMFPLSRFAVFTFVDMWCSEIIVERVWKEPDLAKPVTHEQTIQVQDQKS